MESPRTGGTKRKTVQYDPDTRAVIPDAKRPRLSLDSNLKVKVLKFISLAYVSIARKAALESVIFLNNLNVGIQITNILFTCHSILRQRAAGKTGIMANKTTGKEFTITYLSRGLKISTTDALKEVDSSAIECGLEYKAFSLIDPSNWYGVAGPYLNFFMAFGLRFNELRLGHSSMPISKNEEETRTIPLSKYGIFGMHHILAEGCTYPPHARSSMAQSVGPITALICFHRAENEYSQKWADAAKRMLAMIPFVDDILDVIRARRVSDIAPLFGLVADILCLTTSRQAHRMTFPLNCFVREMTGVDANGDQIFLDRDAELFNVSGKGGFALYKRIMGRTDYTFTNNFLPSHAAQVLFHCIFGTYKEDFGVLREITDQGSWHSRETLAKGFSKSGSTEAKPITPVQMKLYSKLAQANQTGLLASSYQQNVCAPVFSGKRTRNLSEDFFESLGRKTSNRPAAKNLESVIMATSNLLSELIESIKKNGVGKDAGTVEWRDFGGLTFEAHGAVSNIRIVETGQCFLGRMPRVI